MGEKADFRELLWRLWLSIRWYVVELVRQFLDHDCPTRAGALTYTTLFAVVPMMTVAYAMLSILPAYDGVAERIENFVFQNFVPTSSTVVQDYLSDFSRRARGLSIIGFGFLFVTTFMLLVTIEGTFNTIWQVAEPRKGMQRILVYWSVMSLGPPMILGGILISVYLTSLPLLTDLDVFGLGTLVLGYLPLILTCFGFTVLFFAMPNTQVRLRHALVGGLLTMALLEVAKNVFNVVVANSSFTSIYGAFAAVPFFLAWMYMVWVLILSGAIVVRTLAMTPELDLEPTEPLLVKCARILELLYGAHLDGRSVGDAEIETAVPMVSGEKERILRVLLELKVLRQTADGWILGRSLKSLTLWDLYQQLPEGLDLQELGRVRDLDHVVEPLKSLVQFGSNQMAVSLDSVFGGTKRLGLGEV
ncbi:MAG: YihY family inner membrane protein [Pseudomonadota bacterium]